MNRYFNAVIVMLVLSIFTGSAGAVPAEDWNKTFGGTGENHAVYAGQTQDEGYILAGYAGAAQAGNLVWLIETDGKGNMLWNRSFSRGDSNTASSAQKTTDGGYILSGYTGQNTSSYKAWLIKTDSNGSEQWNKTFGKSGFDVASSVQQSVDGGYIIAGRKRSRPDRISEDDFDAWLIKTDANGSEMWNRTYGGTGRDEIASIRLTSDGGYILAGGTNSYRGSWGDAWLVKVDKNGNEQWNRTYYGAHSIVQTASSAQETADGGYIISGIIFPIVDSPQTEMRSDAWLIKTDSTGNEQWNRTFGGKDENRALSILQVSDGGYVLAGDTSSYGANGVDALLLKTDANGNEQWNMTFGGKFRDEADSVSQTKDGGYVLAGSTLSYGAGDWTAWLIKVSGEPAGTATAPSAGPTERAAGFEPLVYETVGLLAAIIFGMIAAIRVRKNKTLAAGIVLLAISFALYMLFLITAEGDYGMIWVLFALPIIFIISLILLMAGLSKEKGK
jgi:hypothetical protein